MEKLTRLFIAVLLVPIAIGAAQAMATETVYVLKNTDRQDFDYGSPEFMEACGFAYPFGVLTAAKSDLYSIQTQSAHGRVVNDHVKKVGELTACVLYPTVASNPPAFFPLYPGLPENILDNSPSQNLNVQYSILLNGEQYFASGSARARTEGGAGIPYPGYFLIGGSATLLKFTNTGAAIVGSLTSNAAIEVVPGNFDQQKTGAIIVLRISEPGFSLVTN